MAVTNPDNSSNYLWTSKEGNNTSSPNESSTNIDFRSNMDDMIIVEKWINECPSEIARDTQNISVLSKPDLSKVELAGKNSVYRKEEETYVIEGITAAELFDGNEPALPSRTLRFDDIPGTQTISIKLGGTCYEQVVSKTVTIVDDILELEIRFEDNNYCEG